MAEPTLEDDLRALGALALSRAGKTGPIRAATEQRIDRIAAALKAADWQPIPEPPPNGTAVLSAPDGGAAVGCWDSAFGTWGVYLGEQEPTHYIALPPTPAERARKQTTKSP